MNKATLKSILTNSNFLIMLIVTIGISPVLSSVKGFYIRGDVTSQMLPFVFETKKMFSSGVPFWSWNTYFGDNFIASYAYYTVFNPFTWINCLFPYKYLGLGFTLVLYLKFLVCGYITQTYLKKMGFDNKLSLLGSILYTFSSWAISNLCFYMFMEPMMLLPFMLIFVERLIAHEKYCCSRLAIATFVMIAVNYYFAVANLISVAIYFICRIFFLYNETKERISISFKAAGCFALGIVCSSFVLIPVSYQLMGTPRLSLGNSSYDVSMLFYRLFWLIYPKAHEGKFFYLFYNECWGSNAASIAVFGILPTILLFVRKGLLWLKWLTGIMVLLYISPLSGIFSLFSDIHYTRWAYALTPALILCTLYYIKYYGLPRFRSAVVYCFIVYGAYLLFASASIYWLYIHSEDSHVPGIRMLWIDIILVIANAIGILLICFKNRVEKKIRVYDVMVIVACVSLQLFVFSEPQIPKYPNSGKTMSETEYFWQHENFRSNNEFNYRTDFRVSSPGDIPACNYGLICNRPSLSTYHSIQNHKIDKWNNIIGDSDLRRVFFPDKHIESFDALMSVKDVVHIYNSPIDDMMSKQVRNRNAKFDMSKSVNYIPLGFAYDRYIISDSVECLAKADTNVDIPKILLASLAIRKEDETKLAPYLIKGQIDKSAKLDSLVSIRSRIVCDRFSGNTKGFEAHINLDTASVIFSSVVADEGFKAYIDGKRTKIFETNLGFSSIIIPSGSHEITFRYFPPGLKIGLIFTILGFCILIFMLLRTNIYYSH